MFVVHDAIQDWHKSSFEYDTATEALSFFENIHNDYHNNYRVVEVINGKVVQSYLHDEFKQIFG